MRNTKPKYQNKKWLTRQYKRKKMSQREIAEKLGVTHSAIYYWVKKFDLDHTKPDYKKEKFLREKFIEEGLNTYEMAQKTEGSREVINTWLHKYNLFEEKYKHRNEKWLRKEYIEKERSLKDIAQSLGFHRVTIREWLQKFDLWEENAQTIIDGKKKCSNCGEWKSLDKFGSDRTTSTGYYAWCKTCDNEKYQDPQARLNRSIGRGISKSIKKSYDGSWQNLVDYDREDLKEHLENQFKDGMTWDNYGLYGWHIDHIIPKSYFKYDNPEDKEFQKCWALENLQPLWAKENLRKADKTNWQKNMRATLA